MPETEQMVAMSLLAIAVGASGWLLPDRWNLLRLKRRYASLVSEEANQRISKIAGTVLIGLGLLLLAGALLR
jgi:hypothetical protein